MTTTASVAMSGGGCCAAALSPRRRVLKRGAAPGAFPGSLAQLRPARARPLESLRIGFNTSILPASVGGSPYVATNVAEASLAAPAQAAWRLNYSPGWLRATLTGIGRPGTEVNDVKSRLELHTCGECLQAKGGPASGLHALSCIAKLQ